MQIMSAIVLFIVIWALVFFVLNPLWQTSQAEDGKIVPGTPASAPVDAMVAKKAIITTVISAILFAIVFATIELEWLTLDMVSWFTLPSER